MLPAKPHPPAKQKAIDANLSATMSVTKGGGIGGCHGVVQRQSPTGSGVGLFMGARLASGDRDDAADVRPNPHGRAVGRVGFLVACLSVLG